MFENFYQNLIWIRVSFSATRLYPDRMFKNISNFRPFDLNFEENVNFFQFFPRFLGFDLNFQHSRNEKFKKFWHFFIHFTLILVSMLGIHFTINNFRDIEQIMETLTPSTHFLLIVIRVRYFIWKIKSHKMLIDELIELHRKGDLKGKSSIRK